MEGFHQCWYCNYTYIGRPNYDLSRFLKGKNYTRGWGLKNAKYEVEGNVVMIGAVVNGKPNPSVDAKTAATQYARPSNWTIWQPDANTPPLKKIISKAKV